MRDEIDRKTAELAELTSEDPLGFVRMKAMVPDHGLFGDLRATVLAVDPERHGLEGLLRQIRPLPPVTAPQNRAPRPA